MSIKVLIERRVSDFIKQYPEFSTEKINKQFLFFSIFNLFKDSKITYDEILDGVVDDTDDYGIDGVYIFSSGQLVDGEEDLNPQISKEDTIKIQFLQVSRDLGFSETALLKFRNAIEQIFDLEKDIKGNKNFDRKVELIRKVWIYCFDLVNIKGIEIELIYISLSDTEKIERKIQNIESDIYKYLKKQGLKRVKIKYIGMPSLYKIITINTYEKELIFKEMTSYAETYNTKVVGYYGLVKLNDFLKFITNEEGEIEENYFEGNVRDYYGISKKVNRKIKDTLSRPDGIMNFWCLNNGITIICEKSNLLGKKIKLFNFHIVNGCQTAHVIYDCKKMLEKDDRSEILVKVIQTKNEDIANDIIDATNSQTAVSLISLHSNDLIQKNLEEHFAKYSKMPLFYERRINYYKRRNKPSNRIVTMMKLFQVFYSIFEKKPSVSRGRPTESFDKNYDTVFNTAYDYDAYLISYLLYLKICIVNREEKRKSTGDTIGFLVRQYGAFHIVRIAFSIFMKSDFKINLKEKKNSFVKEKDRLFSLINSDNALISLYKESSGLLRKCVADFKKKNKEAVLNYNLLKNEELDKKINRELHKKFKTA